jgi:hypothetical protein
VHADRRDSLQVLHLIVHADRHSSLQVMHLIVHADRRESAGHLRPYTVPLTVNLFVCVCMTTRQLNKASSKRIWEMLQDMCQTASPVATWSKASVYGRSPTAIVGLNPSGGMDVCLLCVLCVVTYRSL